MRTIHQLTSLLKSVKATTKPPNTGCNPNSDTSRGMLDRQFVVAGRHTHSREVIGLVGFALRHLSGVSEWSKLEISCGVMLFYSLCVCMHESMGMH